MKRTKEELLANFNVIAGDNQSDEVLQFLEDLTDSMEVPEVIEDADHTEEVNWEQKYNELDSSWRTKYRERFFGAVEEKEDTTETEEETEEIPADEIQIDDIFVEKE